MWLLWLMNSWSKWFSLFNGPIKSFNPRYKPEGCTQIPWQQVTLKISVKSTDSQCRHVFSHRLSVERHSDRWRSAGSSDQTKQLPTPVIISGVLFLIHFLHYTAINEAYMIHIRSKYNEMKSLYQVIYWLVMLLVIHIR